MKRQVSLLACLFVAATAMMAQPKQGEPDSWKRYTIEGEDVSVTLPTPPTIKTDEVFVTRLEKKRSETRIGAHADGAVYALSICQNAKVRQSLKDFIVQQNEIEGWSTVAESTVEVDGVSGKQYSFLLRRVPVTAQYFAVKDRLYEFTVTGAPPENVGLKQFFSSIAFRKLDAIAISDQAEAAAPQPGILSKEADVKPRYLVRTVPSYTKRAREEQLSGTVVLKVLISSGGIVTDVQIQQGVRGLTERGIETARRIRAIPAMKDGKYVSTWMQVEYNFRIF